MRKSKFCWLFFCGAMIIGAYFFTDVHAQTDSSDTMAIQDVEAVPDSSAEVVQEGIQGVESVPTAKTMPIVQRNPAGSVANAIARKPAPAKEVLSKKQSQSKTMAAVLISIGVFIGALVIFVFIMLYFFQKPLRQLLDKSSKDRKFLNETFKRFNIDIDKIFPPGPGGSMKK